MGGKKTKNGIERSQKRTHAVKAGRNQPTTPNEPCRRIGQWELYQEQVITGAVRSLRRHRGGSLAVFVKVWDDGLNAPRAESVLDPVLERSSVQNHRDVTIANSGATSLAGIEGRHTRRARRSQCSKPGIVVCFSARRPPPMRCRKRRTRRTVHHRLRNR